MVTEVSVHIPCCVSRNDVNHSSYLPFVYNRERLLKLSHSAQITRLPQSTASRLLSLVVANFRRTRRGRRGRKLRWRPLRRDHLVQIGVVNTRSLLCKSDAIYHLILDTQLDVLAVTESLLSVETGST